MKSAPQTASLSEIKVFYADDPDPEKAGQGLAMAPLLGSLLNQDTANYWQMSPSEQLALIYVLQQLRPKVAIEIGTKYGGSLQVLSKFCEKVYSLDIDPEVPKRLAGKYSNVEYLIGSSTKTLPELLKKLQAEKAELTFVLVDGDHSAPGVKADLDAILQFKPTAPLYVIMHDSFNPECRAGLRAARWSECPFVHLVELDFVTGIVNPSPNFRGQLWGGLALAILKPERPAQRVEVIGRAEMTFQAACAAQPKPPLMHRVRRRVKKILSPR